MIALLICFRKFFVCFEYSIPFFLLTPVQRHETLTEKMHHPIRGRWIISDSLMPDVNNFCVENVRGLMYGQVFLEYCLIKRPLFKRIVTSSVSIVVKLNIESHI